MYLVTGESVLAIWLLCRQLPAKASLHDLENNIIRQLDIYLLFLLPFLKRMLLIFRTRGAPKSQVL
jgi:hypothetical protein